MNLVALVLSGNTARVINQGRTVCCTVFTAFVQCPVDTECCTRVKRVLLLLQYHDSCFTQWGLTFMINCLVVLAFLSTVRAHNKAQHNYDLFTKGALLHMCMYSMLFLVLRYRRSTGSHSQCGAEWCGVPCCSCSCPSTSLWASSCARRLRKNMRRYEYRLVFGLSCAAMTFCTLGTSFSFCTKRCVRHIHLWCHPLGHVGALYNIQSTFPYPPIAAWS